MDGLRYTTPFEQGMGMADIVGKLVRMQLKKSAKSSIRSNDYRDVARKAYVRILDATFERCMVFDAIFPKEFVAASHILGCHWFDIEPDLVRTICLHISPMFRCTLL